MNEWMDRHNSITAGKQNSGKLSNRYQQGYNYESWKNRAETRTDRSGNRSDTESPPIAEFSSRPEGPGSIYLHGVPTRRHYSQGWYELVDRRYEASSISLSFLTRELTQIIHNIVPRIDYVHLLAINRYHCSSRIISMIIISGRHIGGDFCWNNYRLVWNRLQNTMAKRSARETGEYPENTNIVMIIARIAQVIGLV